MQLEEVRKTIEATIENITPAGARRLAKDYLEPGAAKDQISKTASELLDWSHRNRERLREFVAHEVSRQMKAVGVATRSDVDALKKRVRELERTAGMTASGRKKATRKSGARKTTGRTSAAPTTTASKPARPATRATE